MKFEYERDKILVLLLITDAIFVLFHILNVYTDLLSSSLYSLKRDQGYGEFFQYTKELWIAVLFLILGFKKKKGVYFAFAMLVFFFLFDDYFSLHEQLGIFIAQMLNFQPALGLRGIDFGELLFSAVIGILFLVLFILFSLISDRQTRLMILYMLIFIVLLAGFGVLLDMTEVIIKNSAVSRVVAIFEEGGEMFVMSWILWFVMRINLYDDELPLNWLPIKKKEHALSD